METIKQLALIGPTASGKTSLSIKLAQKIDAYILSLDSLAIYKEIDIVSAKPTKEERDGVVHFGIDHLYPDEPFDVTTFIKLYQEVKASCMQEGKSLVIVGGTSFYLKVLLEGVSPKPSLNTEDKARIEILMRTPHLVHRMLQKVSPEYMSHIPQGDTYRVRKALEVYIATNEAPDRYFAKHPPQPVLTDPLPIYEIVWDRQILRERIRLRTEQMVAEGLIDEIIALERKYTRAPNCMKAIGIKETLMYLDGIYDKEMLIEKIAINTGRLAKRQMTFNHSQFENVLQGSLEDLKKTLL